MPDRPMTAPTPDLAALTLWLEDNAHIQRDLAEHEPNPTLRAGYAANAKKFAAAASALAPREPAGDLTARVEAALIARFGHHASCVQVNDEMYDALSDLNAEERSLVDDSYKCTGCRHEDAKVVAAALARSAGPPDASREFFMIENDQYHRAVRNGMWWRGRDVNDLWTDDVHAAVHFANRADAEATHRSLTFGMGTMVTGHLWMSAPAPTELSEFERTVSRLLGKLRHGETVDVEFEWLSDYIDARHHGATPDAPTARATPDQKEPK